MARLSALQVLDRTLRDAFGRNARSTERGLPAYQTDQSFGSDAIGAARKALGSDPITFQRPSRDHALAYLTTEIYTVCSSFSRSIRQLAGDAAQDAMADIQPFTVTVREKNDTLRRKQFEILDTTFRRLRIGLTTEMRARRTLLTGTAVGQPIFEQDGARWHLTKYKLMPTFEMIRNGKENTWKQVRDGKTIGEWNVPNFMAVSMNDEDDDHLYGTPIGALVIVDYRSLVMSLQDLTVAARTRAPRRTAHFYGDGTQDPGPKALESYKARNAHGPMLINTDLWLRKGFEDARSLEGDAAGVNALLEVFNAHESRMIRAVGITPRPEDTAGRGLESIDADYARRINIVRMNDFNFIKSIGDKALILEGYSDVDWSALIPPLGETESNRTKRASEELWRGHSSWERYCQTLGIPDPETEQEGIKRWFQFLRTEGVPLVQGDKEANSKQDVVGSESSDQGADPAAGRSRRAEQKRSGKTPTGA